MSEGLEQQKTSNAAYTAPSELVAAAHELKTPLTIIAHLAATVQDDSIGLSPAEQKTAVERIKLSAERTLRLVQGLTISHRLEQDGQLAFRFVLEPLNATQICEEAMHELSPLALQCNQTLRLQTARKPQLVVGNSELLKSVFLNLMDNAIKHNPPQTSVDVHMRRRQNVVRVCVQDNGPGFSSRDLASLRATLGQQLQPLHGRAGSSGLGLYIAGQMALAMGGKVGLGQTKQGADFHVDLLHSKQLSMF